MYRKGNSYSAPSMWDVQIDPDSVVKWRDHISVQDISKNIPAWHELVTVQLVQHAVNKLAEIEARYGEAKREL